MKQVIYKVSMALSAVLILVSLVGCTTSFGKRQAFREYVSSFNSDVVTMESFTITAGEINNCKDYKSLLSVINTEIVYLDELVKSAEKRNATITDPEIKEMDDSYVQALKDLKNGYKMYYEGINENDQKKMDLGDRQADSCLQNIKDYANKMKKFADKYNMGGDEEFEKLEDMLNSL